MNRHLLIFFLILLLAGRLYLSTQSKHGDIYNNTDWGRAAHERGLVDFYESPKEAWPHSRPNQPPGSIIIHYFSYETYSKTARFIHWSNEQFRLFPSKTVWWWERHGELVSMKLPSIAADFLAAWAVFRIVNHLGRRNAAWVAAAIYLLNPALWYNSTYWGQTDSIVAAWSLWSIVYLYKKRIALSAALLGLSLITKASWAPMLPLFALYVFRNYTRQTWKIIWAGVSALSVATMFHPRIDLPVWLLNLYTTRILPGESGFLTVNAFNLWHILSPTSITPDTMTIAGLPAQIWAMIIVGIVLGYAAIRVWREISLKSLIHWLAVVFFAVFLFATRMHERYLYPVIPLMTILLGINWKLWKLYLLISVTYLVNMYSLWWSPNIPVLVRLYTTAATQSVSIVNLLAFVWLFRLKSRSHDES